MKNRLDQIVTKSGDSGQTSISPTKRISKNSSIVHFLGDLDECNAYIGTLKAELFTLNSKKNSLDDVINWLTRIQHNLFDIGGAICSRKIHLFDKGEVSFLEEIISEINQELPPLKEFVLPGGSSVSAKAHVARTVARRSERSLVNVFENNIEYGKYVDSHLLPYLNRLSDFLFVLGRKIDKSRQVHEQVWNNRQKKEN